VRPGSAACQRPDGRRQRSNCGQRGAGLGRRRWPYSPASRRGGAAALRVHLVDRKPRGQVGDVHIEQITDRLPIRGGAFEHRIQDDVVAGDLVNPLRQGLPVQRAIHDEVHQAVLARVGAGGNGGDQGAADALGNEAVFEPPPDTGDVRDRQVHLLH